jgi:hypothetical protein
MVIGLDHSNHSHHYALAPKEDAFGPRLERGHRGRWDRKQKKMPPLSR